MTEQSSRRLQHGCHIFLLKSLPCSLVYFRAFPTNLPFYSQDAKSFYPSLFADEDVELSHPSYHFSVGLSHEKSNNHVK